MNLKHVAVASLLAASSAAAFAGTQTVTLDLSKSMNHFDSSNATGVLFEGGFDTISFLGATPGKYNVTITLSGQGVEFNSEASTLNGLGGSDYYDSYSKKWSFMGLEATADSPFVLNLAGSVKNLSAAGYSGDITISPVPEPTTYGMLLGGLGIMGFLARRKSKQA